MCNIGFNCSFKGRRRQPEGVNALTIELPPEKNSVLVGGVLSYSTTHLPRTLSSDHHRSADFSGGPQKFLKPNRNYCIMRGGRRFTATRQALLQTMMTAGNKCCKFISTVGAFFAPFFWDALWLESTTSGRRSGVCFFFWLVNFWEPSHFIMTRSHRAMNNNC